MATTALIGQAAGTAARLAIDAGVPVADVDVKALQEELLKNDAFLG